MSEEKDQLRQQIEELIPINELPANLQNKLMERGKILTVKKSRFLFKQGDKDDYSYYLLDGEIELHQNDQLNGVIEAGSDRAKYALAQLQPRQFSAKAKTEIKILLIERNHSPFWSPRGSQRWPSCSPVRCSHPGGTPPIRPIRTMPRV